MRIKEETMPRNLIPMRGVLLLLLVVAIGIITVPAGDLAPPSPPAPTMKTLAEVEPRIPILPTAHAVGYYLPPLAGLF